MQLQNNTTFIVMKIALNCMKNSTAQFESKIMKSQMFSFAPNSFCWQVFVIVINSKNLLVVDIFVSPSENIASLYDNGNR